MGVCVIHLMASIIIIAESWLKKKKKGGKRARKGLIMISR